MNEKRVDQYKLTLGISEIHGVSPFVVGDAGCYTRKCPLG